MPERRRVVMAKSRRSSSELPPWASEGAVLAEWMMQRGLWSAVDERLRVARPGGFVGKDIVLWLLLYFASRLRCSLKDFGARCRLFGRSLAALAHRRELPTPSSISRFLSVVDHDHTRALAPWLLLEACDAASVLRHPAACSRDTLGETWHFCDWDGSNTVVRHRALPQDVGLPEAQRRSAALAKPGYTGRKRGEARFGRATLQHAGTGLWLDMAATSDRADTAAMLPSALRAVERMSQLADIARERIVVRSDGAGGNVPWIAACQKAGVSYLTRSAHYTLFDDPAVQARLSEATWYRAPSSLSGPVREVAELGWLELSPGPRSVDSQGEPFSPVRTRMAVSRFGASDKSGAGVVRGEYQYELFATSLPSTSWPAPELVQSYFARSAEENRFAQEDRELQLDRILSYHLPGQELACLVGLFVWNLRIVHGAVLASPPTELPPQTPRETVVTSAPPNAPLEVHIAPAGEHDAPAATRMPASLSDPSANDAAQPPPTASIAELATDEMAQEVIHPQSLHEILEEVIDWPALFDRLPRGWCRTDDRLGLRCANGATLPIVRIKPAQHRILPVVQFRASSVDCRHCTMKTACGATSAPNFAKTIGYSIPNEHEEQMTRALARERSDSSAPSAPPALTTRVPRPAPHRLLERTDAPAAGPWAVATWRLLPAELRRVFEQACRNVTVRVERPPVPPVARRPLGIIYTVEEAQRRRTSWSMRARRNALPDGHPVTLTLEGAEALGLLLEPAAATPAASIPKIAA